MTSPASRSWIWKGDQFVAEQSLPLSDRGLRYGMSVFESVRLADAQPRYLAAHLDRLRNACAVREFHLDPRAIAAAGELLEGCGGDGFARIYVTAGDGGPTQPALDCRVFILIEERERLLRVAYDLELADEPFHPHFAGIKTGNYWANLDLLRRAQQRQMDEALLFNERAELVSACVANVFVVHGSRIRTPALHCGARAGVIRELVMRRAAVEEGSLFVDDVHSADEIFLTNSWIGVRPVATLAGRTLPSRQIAESLGDL